MKKPQAVKVSEAKFETTKQFPALQMTATLYLVDGQEVLITETAEDRAWKVFTPALDTRDRASESPLESRYTVQQIVDAITEAEQGIIIFA